jgi:hypothetical protein
MLTLTVIVWCLPSEPNKQQRTTDEDETRRITANIAKPELLRPPFSIPLTYFD